MISDAITKTGASTQFQVFPLKLHAALLPQLSTMLYSIIVSLGWGASALASPWSLVPRDKNPLYRNASACVDDRVEDLLSRMSLEDKVGQMFQQMLRIGENYTVDQGSPGNWNSTKAMVLDKRMKHFNLVGTVDDARRGAEWYNQVQKMAVEDGLGIPITLSSDPRHGFGLTVGASLAPGIFSQWPETLGLAALRDPVLVRTFANIVREEYVSVGIRAALHPQVDIATEPRWARVYGTWGEDAHLTAELITEYIKGLQRDEIGPRSVTTVTKHFPGGGAAQGGEDSHFTEGQNATYPGNNLEYHLISFKAAFKAGARQIMPYYSRPVGTDFNSVGFSFNKEIVTNLLKDELGFKGIVVTDWGLVTDGKLGKFPWPARAWGVQDATEGERATMIIEAGCDQFGGEERPELVVDLVKSGRISEKRIDESVRKLLKEKFLLGLFENPYVDPDEAERIAGNAYFRNLGEETQRRAYTLLSNKDDVLPLKLASGSKVFCEGFNTTKLEARGYKLAENPEEADFALLRLKPPYDPRNGTIVGAFGQRTGTLEYFPEEKKRQAAIYAAVPTVAEIFVDRPIAIPEVVEQTRAVLASFGSSDDAFLDVVFGDAAPEGKLPFDMLRSDEAALEQMEDVPFDTRDPVFKFGHGLRYKSACEASKGHSCQ
ncbi:periplasmic beta-glucosidase precursor [Purpureocillium lavendulum]|uniref:beta-glucosidase n=1 Tax=Purpureocillium lavendulum TaxID=1247861 RepID=A0AB34G768_9HYPO|nr:periplasmic beta-glucosidase precursor [Purpureocillium lavendulum]